MHDLTLSLLDRAQAGHKLSAEDIHLLAENAPHAELLQAAEALTLAGHGSNVGYSRKVFIPLTRLCRNTCGYCTFATTPKSVPSAYLSADEVLAIACQTGTGVLKFRPRTDLSKANWQAEW